MAEDPVPIEGVAVKSGDFRAVTKATGDALRRKLEEDTDSAIKNKGFDSYEIKPYEKDLENVMKLFRETECQALHHGGDFEWRSIRLITRTVSLNKEKCSEAPKNYWVLPLIVGRNNTVGQPLRLCELYEVSEGDVYLRFDTIKA